MPNSPNSVEINLLTWNVNRSSIDHLHEQLAAIYDCNPDILALQEVGVEASRKPRYILRQHGYPYVAHSHEFRPDNPGNSSGIAFASRWPFRVLAPETFEMPYQHQALSAVFHTPVGLVEGHSVHVLPGRGYGIEKVEMFEGVYEALAIEDPPKFRFLCGDFNSPKEETADGEVTVFGTDERKIAAERSVIVDLAEYDLPDVYRELNGYGDDAYSHIHQYDGGESRLRFDHVFASPQLNPTQAEYLHEYDDLSDHTPLSVEFTPPSEESLWSHLDERGETPGRGTGQPAFRGLRFSEDARVIAPDDNRRLGRFKVGWNKAVEGVEYGEVLETLTWENLGWRLGELFGEASEESKEALYEWCVGLQLEKSDGDGDGDSEK